MLFSYGWGMAVARLWCAVGPRTVCRLVAGGAVAGQHVLGRCCGCDSLGVPMALLNNQNFKVAIARLSRVRRV